MMNITKDERTSTINLTNDLTETDLISMVMNHDLYDEVYEEYIEDLDCSADVNSEFEQFFSVLELLYKYNSNNATLIELVHVAHKIVKQRHDLFGEVLEDGTLKKIN